MTAGALHILGFEVNTDEPYGEERWIEVAPPDGPLLVLVSRSDAEAGAPEMPGSPILFTCDDIERTHRELAERGVRFPTPPRRMPFGWWAVFEDGQGTRYGLGQNGPAAAQPAGGAADLDVLVGRWRTRGSTVDGVTGAARADRRRRQLRVAAR